MKQPKPKNVKSNKIRPKSQDFSGNRLMRLAIKSKEFQNMENSGLNFATEREDTGAISNVSDSEASTRGNKAYYNISSPEGQRIFGLECPFREDIRRRAASEGQDASSSDPPGGKGYQIQVQIWQTEEANKVPEKQERQVDLRLKRKKREEEI